jgi:hypothetical protein
MIFDDSSWSEEEEDEDLEMALMLILNDNFRRPRLGSQFGRVCINRNRADDYARTMRDFFSPDAIYTDKQFQRRFRMQKDLFRTIAKAAEDHYDWFKLRRNACGEMSASPIMK